MLLIGRLPASLGLFPALWQGMFFGGITGSAQASTSCMGGILIPSMKEEDIPQKAVGIIAAASTCGLSFRQYHHGCICHCSWLFGWSNVCGRLDSRDSVGPNPDGCIAGP